MEAIRTSPQETQETPCPACGGMISIVSTGRRRRVQCPKCREVVELKPAEKAAPKIAALPTAEPVSPPDGDARAVLAKIAALEARIAALEQAATAQPIEIVVQRPERKWKWLAHSAGHEAEKLPTNVTEVFLQNLKNYDGETITLQVAADDARAFRRAMDLKDVFERADWTVVGLEEIAPRSTETGLFLAVGSLPLPPAAAATYFAMTTSGFTVQSFLDPKLANDETILIVA